MLRITKEIVVFIRVFLF